MKPSLSSWLEQLDRIAVGILHLNLAPTRTDLHLIAELHPSFRQRVDPREKIGDAQDHPIPSARLLRLTTGHGTRAGCSRPTEQQRERSERNAGECGQLLMFELEAEMVRVKSDSPGGSPHLIAHAVHAADTLWLSTLYVGVAGIVAGWEEGLELNLLGLTFGVDPVSLSLKLPLLGRIGASDHEPVIIE
jgi:hypothetical protein